MLIQATMTAAGPGENPVFDGLPTPDGFSDRQHIKDGEIFDVSNALAKTKLAMRSGDGEDGFPIFREITRQQAAAEFGFTS